MPLRRIFMSGLFAAMLCVSSAQAHFIWVVTEPGEHPKVAKVYLSEEAAPDDPKFLQKIASAKTFVVGGRDGKAHPVELKVNGDALVAEIPARQSGNPVVVNHTYGVMSRGEVPFLLQYYGKTYPSQLTGSWDAVNNVEVLPLEVTPVLKGNELTLDVAWKGEPAPGCQVTVEGPGLKERIQGDTNAQGQFVVQVPQAGLYSIRARKEEKASGELDGKKYDLVKHYSTLSLNVTPAMVQTNDQKWPALARGMTSFGAAVVGDDLYVYGGHLGGAHEYHAKDQSNDFLRLNLSKPGSWEKLPSGPKRTGLAMVAHQGKVYRVGGFEVVSEGDDNLASQTDFARFDPARNAWEDLAPLPEGRSSHDAVVVGDTLYVIGGWQLRAGEKYDNAWLKTAWSCDLSQEKPQWKEIAAPGFERRAISLATRDGLIYMIGGMQSKGGPTTKVAVYDPAKGSWSEGPALLGNGMDGFGTASYCLNGQLITTTMSGAIQRLSADGTHWEYLGQVVHPRFFHEMVPWQHSLVLVGGASMQTGKALELENLPLSQPEAADQKAALK